MFEEALARALAQNPDHVRATEEFERVRDLEVFDWRDSAEEARAFVESKVLKPGSKVELRPIQIAALATASAMGGLFAPARTGAGKSLISILLPTMWGCTRPLLLIPAAREIPTRELVASLANQLHIVPPTILSYERLSTRGYADALRKIEPDCIIADEAHCMKNPSGSRAKRVFRYDPVPLAVLSGSFTSRSLMDYWHLLGRALGKDNMPAPAIKEEALEWARALDSKTIAPLQPGALLDIMPEDPDDGEGYEAARKRFGRRLISTRGVVSSGHDVPNIPLEFEIIRLEPTEEMVQVADHLRTEWETPCGLPFELAIELWRHEQETSCGLYYRPRVEPPAEWRSRRKAWSKWLRTTLSLSRKLDTPAQVVDVLDTGSDETLPFSADPNEGRELLRRWREIEPTYTWESVPVWFDESTLEFCAEWLTKNHGIVWVEHSAFGERLSRMTKVPYFRTAGCDAEGRHIEKYSNTCIASIRSCGTGHNLQALSKNLIVTCPSTNSALEQLISRTHRDGQQNGVRVEFLQRLDGDSKALDQARKDASMVESTFCAPQRLTVGKWLQEA